MSTVFLIIFQQFCLKNILSFFKELSISAYKENLVDIAYLSVQK